MTKFKKNLSVLLALLTISGAIPVRSEDNKSNKKTEIIKTTAAVATVAVSGIATVIIYCAMLLSSKITVGIPGHELMRDDLKQYAEKRVVTWQGVIPQCMHMAGRPYEVDIVEKDIIKVDDGVISIADNTFSDCIIPEKIIISKSVQHIGRNAFTFFYIHSPNKLKISYNGKDYNGSESFFTAFQANHGQVD